MWVPNILGRYTTFLSTKRVGKPGVREKWGKGGAVRYGRL